MKRYKKEPTFQKLAEKYKTFYFFGFALGYLLIILAIGFAVYFSITAIYYRNAEVSINDYIARYNSDNEPDTSDKDKFPIKFIETGNPSLLAVVFYTDANNRYSVEEYSVVSVHGNDMLYWEIINDFSKNSKEDKFELSDLGGYYYRSVVKKIENSSYNRDGYSMYVKVYCNINGELESRESFLNIYVFVGLLAFVLSFIVATLLMRTATKPLNLFVSKQTDFVSDASHELRTPLAVVRSKIENVLAYPDKTVYEICDDLAISLQEISRLTKLTEELLTLARSDKDNITLDYYVFDLNLDLKDIIEPFIEIGELKDKKVSYSGLPCIVKLDRDKVKQIFIILIDNALKYTEEGGSINVDLDVTKDEVIVTVADTGIGLNDEAKKKVFERFYRADKARSRESGGNGLGLPIAYTLISLQNGKIDIYDNEPKGTKFVVSFPKARDRDIYKVDL